MMVLLFNDITKIISFLALGRPSPPLSLPTTVIGYQRSCLVIIIVVVVNSIDSS